MSWEVVGGGDKGGILVRAGQATSSEQLAERLATGALVEQLQLIGERLEPPGASICFKKPIHGV